MIKTNNLIATTKMMNFLKNPREFLEIFENLRFFWGFSKYSDNQILID